MTRNLRAAQGLPDSERRFRALAEAIPVICWTADPGGWIDWYNRRWFEFTGQRPDEALGWGWQAAHHPDDFLEVMRSWPHSIVSGKPFEMEHRLRRHDGRFLWFLTRVEPLRGPDGRIERWYGSIVDIDAQKRALERTKRVAETLQELFLPKELPQAADVRFDAVYQAAEREGLVGGDWYDAFTRPDGSIVVSIGDVAGHGLEASMSAGRLRQAIFTLAFGLTQPDQVLERLDAMLAYQEPGVLVTALVAFIAADRSTLSYASAGHPAPIVAYRNDEPGHALPAGGTPLGTGLAATFEQHSVPLQRDAVVAFYTDGMIEFSRDVFTAEERLCSALARVVGDTGIAKPARAVQRAVFGDLPARDDAALLLAQFSHVDPSELRSDPSTLGRVWRFHSSDAHTAHTSRREIVMFLRRLTSEPDNLFVAELILGEILSNTVEHAPGLVEVRVDWSGEKPVATVRDTGPGLRALGGRLPDDILSEGGRGMFLISELADDVTVRPAPGYGTEIRAVLPLRRSTR